VTSGGDAFGGLAIAPDKVGAGLAPDKETEMRIREGLERKWAFEKEQAEEEKKKKRNSRRSIV